MIRSIWRILRVLFNHRFRRQRVKAVIESMDWKADDTSFKLAVEAVHPMVVEMARAMAATFEDCKGTNFVEMSCHDPVTLETYTLTLRPHSRPAPAEVCFILRTALESIAAHPGNWPVVTAEEALRKTGYRQ